MQAAPPTSGGSWGADAAVGQATQQMLVPAFVPSFNQIIILLIVFASWLALA
jgi:hypothetical protein